MSKNNILNSYRINYSQNGGSSTKSSSKSIILLDGTSSSGKSTICNFFKSEYKCLITDDYWEGEKRKIIQKKHSDFKKTIPNEYTIGRRELFDQFLASKVIDDALKTGKAIIDTVSPQIFIDEINRRELNDQLYIILLYTSINDLARNIESRRLEGDPRGTFVFDQFAERYTKTDKDGIDTVNRKKFNKILLDNFKYDFKNKEELDKFSVDVFEKMGINDDKDHLIKVKDEVKYDYLLNTVGKSREEIFKEVDFILGK